MASIVLNGTSAGSFSTNETVYTNNTGGNVRVVINYMQSTTASNIFGNSSRRGIFINGISQYLDSQDFSIGRNLASISFQTTASTDSTTLIANNAGPTTNTLNFTADQSVAFPTELMLANGQTLVLNCGRYNIVIIPENG